MIKQNWKKIVGLTVLALTISGLTIVPMAMADEGDDSSSSPQPGERCEMFKGKVAGNLGVTTDALDTAVKDAMTEMIDEAVADGKITAEQADEIKQRIEENGGMCGWMKHRPHHGPGMMGTGMLDKAVEESIITKEQADEITSVMEDVRAYCEENGCVRAEGNPLEKAVENGVITQDQADEIQAIMEQVRDQMCEDGGFRGHRFGDGEGSMDIENGSFPQRGCRGGPGMMGMGEAA